MNRYATRVTLLDPSGAAADAASSYFGLVAVTLGAVQVRALSLPVSYGGSTNKDTGSEWCKLQLVENLLKHLRFCADLSLAAILGAGAFFRRQRGPGREQQQRPCGRRGSAG